MNNEAALMNAPYEAWLRQAMKPYFFDAMRDEPGALAILARELGSLRENGHLILVDRPSSLIVAVRNTPGSLYRALTQRSALQRPISYAMVQHSKEPIPGLKETLEIQRFEFAFKRDADVSAELKAGANVHVRTVQGLTCLHVLAELGRGAGVLCLVLKAGADPTAEDDRGMTPAQTAQEGDNMMGAALLERAARDWQVVRST